MKIVPKCSPEDSRSSVTSASVRMPESLPQTTAGIITIGADHEVLSLEGFNLSNT